MMTVGLTGGIGMGKTESARLLSRWGVPVVDTDHLARDEVSPGSEGLEEVLGAFGPEYGTGTGGLDRERMASLVFSDPVARRRLEDILHPRIHRRWKACLEQWRQDGFPLGVVVIPLLFEKGYATEFDAIVCVACSIETQQYRLRERGWSEDQMQQRIASQWPTQEKMDAASHVVWSEGVLDVLAGQWSKVLSGWGIAIPPP
jgi:dephospho-CoA kinase